MLTVAFLNNYNLVVVVVVFFIKFTRPPGHLLAKHSFKPLIYLQDFILMKPLNEFLPKIFKTYALKIQKWFIC